MTKNQRSFDRPGDKVLGNAVGEVFLLLVAAHVGEWQHGDRGPVGTCSFKLRSCGGRCLWGSLGEGDAVDTDWPRDVLDGLLAQILEAEAQLVAYLIVDIA